MKLVASLLLLTGATATSPQRQPAARRLRSEKIYKSRRNHDNNGGVGASGKDSSSGRDLQLFDIPEPVQINLPTISLSMSINIPILTPPILTIDDEEMSMVQSMSLHEGSMSTSITEEDSMSMADEVVVEESISMAGLLEESLSAVATPAPSPFDPFLGLGDESMSMSMSMKTTSDPTSSPTEIVSMVPSAAPSDMPSTTMTHTIVMEEGISMQQSMSMSMESVSMHGMIMSMSLSMSVATTATEAPSAAPVYDTPSPT